MDHLTKQVEEYWDSHHLGTQFLPKSLAEVGSKEYFMQYDQAMERWEYKNRLIDWIRLQAQSGCLLEVGCGLGHDLVKFAARGLSVTGIDLAKSVATMAKKHLEAYGLDGSILQVNAESLSFSSNVFDVIYSCGVLQHVPNIQKAIDEIYRVVKTDGIVVVIVYYKFSYFNLISALTRANIEFEDGDPPVINTYSKRKLNRLFSRFKEVVIDLEYCYPSLTPRKGILSNIYNNIFIPVLCNVPYKLMKNFGWHAVIKARK